MVVDIREVRRHIKPKADSTLRNMRKEDLIDYIRCLENNYNVAVSFNENQAKYIESLTLSASGNGRWLDNADSYICSQCGYETANPNKNPCGPERCPRCFAKMDKE